MSNYKIRTVKNPQGGRVTWLEKKKITILGGGRVGRAIAYDLKDEYTVTVVDNDSGNLFCIEDELGDVNTINANVLDESSVKRIIKNADLVISALPGWMGGSVAEDVLDAGKDLVDISFFPEDPRAFLARVAEESGARFIPDAGVAPGLSNILAGYGHAQFEDTTQLIDIKVGGLPKDPNCNVFKYKAAWSPADVIEEYVRPAYAIWDGKEVVREALSGLNNVKITGLELEEFNTDGLRTLLTSLPNVPFISEKTLRYRGHAKQMKFLRDAGFFDNEKLVGTPKITPRDVTQDILFPQWKFEPGEVDITVMQVNVINDKGRVFTWNLYDEMDQKTGLSSMSRCTGFTAAQLARLLLEEKETAYCPGLICPEYIGNDFEYVDQVLLPELRKRGIFIIKLTKEG